MADITKEGEKKSTDEGAEAGLNLYEDVHKAISTTLPVFAAKERSKAGGGSGDIESSARSSSEFKGIGEIEVPSIFDAATQVVPGGFFRSTSNNVLAVTSSGDGFSYSLTGASKTFQLADHADGVSFNTTVKNPNEASFDGMLAGVGRSQIKITPHAASFGIETANNGGAMLRYSESGYGVGFRFPDVGEVMVNTTATGFSTFADNRFGAMKIEHDAKHDLLGIGTENTFSAAIQRSGNSLAGAFTLPENPWISQLGMPGKLSLGTAFRGTIFDSGKHGSRSAFFDADAEWTGPKRESGGAMKFKIAGGIKEEFGTVRDGESATDGRERASAQGHGEVSVSTPRGFSASLKVEPEQGSHINAYKEEVKLGYNGTVGNIKLKAGATYDTSTNHTGAEFTAERQRQFGRVGPAHKPRGSILWRLGLQLRQPQSGGKEAEPSFNLGVGAEF